MNDDYLDRQREICQAVQKELRANSTASRKFLPLEEILEIIKPKRATDILVCSGGVFTVVHHGHTDYLEQAAQYGDIHVVCINSDQSVERIGRRPLSPLHGRVIQIAAPESVHYVTLFDEDTPELILFHLKPGVYVKGADRTINQLPERAVVESNGGRVVLIPLFYEYSASTLVRNIKKNAR